MSEGEEIKGKQGNIEKKVKKKGYNSLILLNIFFYLTCRIKKKGQRLNLLMISITYILKIAM